MPQYTAPLRDMHFVLFDLLKVQDELKALPRYADVDRETIEAVLEEGAKFASQVIQPLNQVGDREGCTWHGDGVVTAPPGFKQAYAQFVEAGWPSVSCDPDFGGQGLPAIVNNRLYEMWNSANQAWLMYPGLSHSAYECLHAFGTDEQKQVYLTKIVSGEWTGTMCLTEPHCGTDLGILKTKAAPNGDGSFALSGTKIFISAGEHDLAPNILHLVLARLPDAPAGTKGISLFLVPKFIPDANGQPGERNAIKAGSIEHKMGIHGNATCVINLDGARGWLIGEPNKGLAAMFVMMNSARLGVGMQSLGQAEVAHQNAVAYAKDRLQGRAPAGAAQPAKAADPIIVHPDVRRMLLTSRAYTEAGRAFTTWTALLIDREHAHPDPAVREEADELMALLTPVVKAFITDNAWETTTLCQQVFGGHGYISEWGMDQFVRDSRINMIYEGTNGIQALDLLGRKVLMDGGKKFGRFAALVQAFLKDHAGNAAMAEFNGPLGKLLADTVALTQELGARAQANPDEVGAASVPYLRIIGHLAYAWMWARMAAVALDKGGEGFHATKLATARFYFAWLLPETAHQFRAARAGAASLMAIAAEDF
ncbi:acyl-CoA dehydrogenase C-terminal domain-containing protein [Arenimonas sp.]|uniref:acyl-CoA dehydrogenase C-terminal domain-containing protein n=1 Tax=Arenimonas sp. TaxID=1872635 RepID=UPI0025BBBDB7|nr:acyl-CoA dehydrogenase C-terminal domain-containing protein [Arenimonas sp.]